ncbi:uncharacterized protein LOC132045644 [Lycium ferocissimum]|uniref:uncharacterized protein LOC132045644 n=1 Tax=Lycium ferocissimum TaxID=112874 RepID=UPI002816409A|nr:uncharacterized protein LOC132045644 [Lycium ferocissimum]
MSKEEILNGDGVLRIKGRICVPRVGDLARLIMEEAHCLKYSIHPRAVKVYRVLKQYYWWCQMKRDIVEFISRCLNCQQVKYEHQKRGSLIQRIPIPEWKWERIVMDFVVLDDMLRSCVIDFGGHWDRFLPFVEFASNNNYHSSIEMAPFESLYGRRCRSLIGWFDAFEVRPWGTDLLRNSSDKVKLIQERLLTAQSRQKSYADWKWDSMLLDQNLTFEEEPIAISDRQIRKVRSKEIALVNVQWRHRPFEEAT